MRHDGYVEVKDRSKDVITSGGENISSVEVEQAIVSRPAVVELRSSVCQRRSGAGGHVRLSP
ncbi:hypothetical protein NF556_16415 [Ornithinimicrobium faecis]|uniref:Uncharacterized protein n=2 Tax=Ornithinimicrobium faecis TaxID=2934158 RepID=A0ABY4YRS0_9MICO|nr:hypothetical protein [Ornithinimicrobium sp. HY1793]USQ79185.1 hypothetical protein NF556_16415 [Ornithinimicrobium sp. HY1793]